MHRIARRDFVPVEARGLARMGVPAREDAMDAMVPCEVRAAANVNETPWGVARRTSIEPRRACGK